MITAKDSEIRVWAGSLSPSATPTKPLGVFPQTRLPPRVRSVPLIRPRFDTAKVPAIYSKVAATAKNEAKKALRRDLSIFIDNNDAMNPPDTGQTRFGQ